MVREEGAVTLAGTGDEYLRTATPLAVGSEGFERRRHTRYRLQLPAVVAFGVKRYSLQTEDVGAAGVFVRMDDPPALRELVRVAIDLPDGTSFATGATVVWRIAPGEASPRTPGAGLQFCALGADARELWQAFVGDVRAAARQVALPPCPPETPEPIRRRYPRYPASFEVRPRDSENLVNFFTRDISAGGMFLATTLDVPLETQLDLDLVHPDSGAVFALSAIVRRGEPPDGLGLEFIGLDAGLRQALWQFIQNGLPEFDVEVAGVGPSDPGTD
jgi:hypothetical protein